MKKFAFIVKGKGYYAKNQLPGLYWSFTDTVEKARIYETISGIGQVVGVKNLFGGNIEICSVEYNVNDTISIVDVGAVETQADELTETYTPTADEDGYICTLTDSEGNSVKSPVQRTKEFAKKKALLKYTTLINKKSA